MQFRLLIIIRNGVNAQHSSGRHFPHRYRHVSKFAFLNFACIYSTYVGMYICMLYMYMLFKKCVFVSIDVNTKSLTTVAITYRL